MVDFTKLAVGLVMAIIGVVIAAEMLAGTYGTLTSALTTLNNTANIPLRALISPTGIIPLVLVAAFFLAIIVGLVALIKSPTR